MVVTCGSRTRAEREFHLRSAEPKITRNGIENNASDLELDPAQPRVQLQLHYHGLTKDGFDDNIMVGKKCLRPNPNSDDIPCR